MTEQSFGPEKPRDRKPTDWAAVVGVLGTFALILTFILAMVKL